MSQEGEEGLSILFNEDLVKKYPRSNRRLSLSVAKYGISSARGLEEGQTMHISPHGIQFRGTQSYAQGELLKVHINMPDYWERKQRFVDYSRIDTPGNFKILVKVFSVLILILSRFNRDGCFWQLVSVDFTLNCRGLSVDDFVGFAFLYSCWCYI